MLEATDFPSAVVILPAGSSVDPGSGTVRIPGYPEAHVGADVVLGGSVSFRNELLAAGHELPEDACLGDRFLNIVVGSD